MNPNNMEYGIMPAMRECDDCGGMTPVDTLNENDGVCSKCQEKQ